MPRACMAASNSRRLGLQSRGQTATLTVLSGLPWSHSSSPVLLARLIVAAAGKGQEREHRFSEHLQVATLGIVLPAFLY